MALKFGNAGKANILHMILSSVPPGEWDKWDMKVATYTFNEVRLKVRWSADMDEFDILEVSAC